MLTFLQILCFVTLYVTVTVMALKNANESSKPRQKKNCVMKGCGKCVQCKIIEEINND